MAGSIKGILVEIGGDTSGLQKALKKVNSETSGLSKELKGINSLLKLDPKNTELLAQKQTVLTGNIKETEEKLKLLKQAQKEADETIKNGGEISQENYRNLQREIVNTQKKLENLNEEYNNFKTENSKFTKVGKTLQEFGEKVDSTSEKINKIGTDVTAKVTTGIAGVATAAITAGASLESAVDKYIAKAGKSVEETEKYKKVLTDINDANFGEGYEDIANSMAIVEQQMRGLDDAADLENITKKAYYLKDAFDAEINESVRAAKMMMEQWGISADEAFELINQGYQKGLDKNGDLLDSINEYSVHFRQIGLSATDMFDTFCLGAESGAFSIDKVGDAIKEMGIRLKDGSTTDTLKSMKLDAKKLEKAFAEGGEKGSWAFGEIVKGLQNIKDPLKQNQAGVAIFGTMWEDLGKDAVFSMTAYGERFDETANTMSSSMDKMYNNTKSSVERSIKRIKTISANLGTKLLPIVNKVLDKAEVFIDKLDNLSDSEKDNIVNIGLLIASAGPLIKIFGTTGTVIGKTSKGIGIFSQALSVAKNNSTSTSKSVNLLAGCMKKIISPAGLATTAILATAGALVYFAAKKSDATKAAEEFANKASNFKQQIDEYNNSIDEAASAELAHIDAVEKLKNELSTLVDENGKVKDGEKSRVQFILNELNNALGTEYSLNGDIIQNYKDLQREIDGTIEKKRAKIKLDAEESKYKNAIEKQAEAVEGMKKAQQDLNMTYEEAKNKLESYNKQCEDALYARGEFANLSKLDFDKKQGELLLKADEMQRLKESIKAYEEYKGTVQICTNDIKRYEDDYAKYTEGKFEEIGNTITIAAKDWKNATIEEIRNGISEQGNALKQYKEIYNKTGNEIANANAEQAKKNLEDLANNLQIRTERLGELGQTEIDAWKNLATQSYDVYQEQLSKMTPEMQKKISDVTEVIYQKTPDVSAATGIMSKEILARLDNDKAFKDEALKSMYGYLNGLNNSDLRSLLTAAGIQDVNKVMEGIREGDLSEEEGKKILTNLNNGLNNKDFKGSLFNTARDIASGIANRLSVKFNIDGLNNVFKTVTGFLPGHKDGLDYVPRDNYVARLHKGERVLTAKENKEYTKMLENLKSPNYAGLQSNLTSKMTSTTNTQNSYNIELKFYPQKMTETELNSAFKYLNRKLGKLY